MPQEAKIFFDTSSSSSSAEAAFGLETAATLFFSTTDSVSADALRVAEANRKAIEKAVFLHIQAVREIGRSSLNTLNIAQALEVPLIAVENSIASLSARGVKVVE